MTEQIIINIIIIIIVLADGQSVHFFFFLVTFPVGYWNRSVVKTTVKLYMLTFNHVCSENTKIEVRVKEQLH